MSPRDPMTLHKIKPMAPELDPALVSLREAEMRLSSILADTLRDDDALPLAQTQRKRADIAKPLHWYALSDALALFVGFVVALGVAIGINEIFMGQSFINPITGEGASQLGQFAVIAAGLLLWFEHKGHYRLRMPFWLETKKIVTGIGFALMLDGFLQFASRNDFSRLWLVFGWGFSALAIITLRAVWRAHCRRNGTWQVATLLIGNGPTAKEARAALNSEPSLGYEIVAEVQDLPEAFQRAGRSWEILCALHGVDYVVVALEGRELPMAEMPLAQLMREDVPFSISPPLRHFPVLGMTPQYFFNHDTMLLTRTSGLEQPLPRFFKRAFDIVASGLALLVLSPVMLTVAALVKMDGGPALFGHKRLGAQGKSFGCLKFRSMVPNADEVLKKHLATNMEAAAEWQREWKLRDDPRVTKLGNFLRKSSLDELPQLINVLKGEMSLVGPRPIVVGEVGKYHNDIAHYYRVRPGITGLWQVSGRNDVSYADRVQMDSWYVRNWSLWHDVAIICKTFPVIFKRTGAY